MEQKCTFRCDSRVIIIVIIMTDTQLIRLQVTCSENRAKGPDYKVTYNNSTSNHYIFDFFLNAFGSSGWQCSIAGDCDDDGYMVSSTAEVSMGSKCRCIDTATPEVSMRKGMLLPAAGLGTGMRAA